MDGFIHAFRTQGASLSRTEHTAPYAFPHCQLVQVSYIDLHFRQRWLTCFFQGVISSNRRSKRIAMATETGTRWRRHALGRTSNIGLSGHRRGVIGLETPD